MQSRIQQRSFRQTGVILLGIAFFLSPLSRADCPAGTSLYSDPDIPCAGGLVCERMKDKGYLPSLSDGAAFGHPGWWVQCPLEQPQLIAETSCKAGTNLYQDPNIPCGNGYACERLKANGYLSGLSDGAVFGTPGWYVQCPVAQPQLLANASCPAGSSLYADPQVPCGGFACERLKANGYLTGFYDGAPFGHPGWYVKCSDSRTLSFSNWFIGQGLDQNFVLGSNPTFAPLNTGFQPVTTIYADAQNGNDQYPGTAIQPVRTLGRAQSLARAAAASLNGDILVSLSGTFRLDQTLSFDSTDSGRDSHFVVYASQGSSQAVVSGGKPLSLNWALFDAQKNIYRASVGSYEFRNLIVNGVLAQRAKSENPLQQNQPLSEGVDCSACGLPAIGQPVNAEIVAIYGWHDFRCSMVWNTDQTITPAPGSSCWSRAVSSFETAHLHFVHLENAYPLLSGPGEWALDNSSHYLYYIPRANEPISTSSFLVPQLTHLISGNAVSNLAFTDIKFSESDWEPLTEYSFDYSPCQGANHNVPSGGCDMHPAAIECAYCENVVFMNLQVLNLATSGIHIKKGTRNSVIFHSTFNNIAGAAVQIGDDVLPVPASEESDTTTWTAGTVVEDNFVSSFGQEYLGSPAIFEGRALRTKISFNQISDGNYVGISVQPWHPANGNWQAGEMENVIAGNNVFAVMKMLGDGAGFYTWENQLGTVVYQNYIHDDPPTPSVPGSDKVGSHGLYFDENTKHALVLGNVIERVPGDAILLHPIEGPPPEGVTLAELADISEISGDSTTNAAIKCRAGPRIDQSGTRKSCP